MYAMFFLLNLAIWNLPAHIYSLTSFAFLEHQTSGFNYTSEANLVPLLIFIARIHIASFTFMLLSPCFFLKKQGDIVASVRLSVMLSPKPLDKIKPNLMCELLT